jgi:hypothetical protein
MFSKEYKQRYIEKNENVESWTISFPQYHNSICLHVLVSEKKIFKIQFRTN